MSSTCFPTFSSYAASPPIFVPTMGRSSSPRRYGSGSQQSVPRPPTSCRAVHGKTAIARASTRNSVTNCSTAKSSTRSRVRWKSNRSGESIAHQTRSSSKTGDSITIQCGPIHHWATSHRHPKQSSGLNKMAQRQHQQWQVDPACTNNKHGSPDGGRPSILIFSFLPGNKIF